MQKMERATLAAGCFWCVEAVFRSIKGVSRVVSGYSGGRAENPGYDAVCTGRTGHAEAVDITFDPDMVSFEQLLQVFWHTHDPTTLNRQGADRGTQYRSVIFYHDENQKKIAERSKLQVAEENLWPDPIVTEIAPFTVFYPAEEYHQEYYRYNRSQPYCQAVIDPKLRKLRKDFAGQLKEEAGNTSI